MNDTRRIAIPEDIEHDPEHKRQRELAGWLLGIAINTMSGSRLAWEGEPDQAKIADQLRKLALANGIVEFDEWHHAPACPANNWSRARLPAGPRTCGAAARKIR
jgi:hypothetical protein